MAAQKIIAVVGATGMQGRGLVRAILADGESGFRVRAITRNVETPGAETLRRLGAEVVAADLDDPDSVARAFEGAYGAFCVTFYWAHFSPEKEDEHVRTMAAAAARAGLKHVVWSTLEDTRKWIPLDDDRMPTLLSRYKVPHFDAKGAADRHFINHGVPTTFLMATFYWDNMIHFGMGPQPAGNGEYVFRLPMGEEPIAGIAGEDIGPAAYGVFRAGDRYVGKFVGIAGEHLTGSEMADAIGRAVGKTVRYEAIEPSAYRALGFPGADDLGNMFQYYRDFAPVFLASRDVGLTKSLHPDLLSFRAWLDRHGAEIPLSPEQ